MQINTPGHVLCEIVYDMLQPKQFLTTSRILLSAYDTVHKERKIRISVTNEIYEKMGGEKGVTL